MRRQIETTRHIRRQHRQTSFYDAPPIDAAGCAALLTLAGGILANASPATGTTCASHPSAT